MVTMMLLSSGVILSCIIAKKFSNKLGMPSLLLFMGLGMIFGCDGIFRISFDDYDIAQKLCNTALVFIMFYGGFGTKWRIAQPVAKKAIILSTAGVVITAFFTSLFCYLILKIEFLESCLIGAVISSTDAASVFSILRSKKLCLKEGTSSLLEIESGSNDPTAYMLTIIVLTLMNGKTDISSILYMLFSQIVYGIVIGVSVALAGIYILKRMKIVTEGLDVIFTIAIVLISFALPELIGGNGYLSVYITGIILGNSKINNKIILVHFFDGITGLAQILIFFLLGLLAFPHRLPQILLPSIAIALFLTFAARPLAVFMLLKLSKASLNQCLVVSWSGLRGAASIVFAIMAVASGVDLQCDLFHIVFMISLLSVAFQGSLLPYISKMLNMVDEECDVRKTFNDYQEESSINLMRIFIPRGHAWENKKIEEVHLPTDSLALMIKRDDETIIPRGNTIINAHDSVIFSIPRYYSEGDIKLKEITIDKSNSWCGKCIEDLELPDNVLIAMIKRKDENIIPRGKTIILENDVVVIYN